MTLDTFFEKFELFAEAPDAVAKMRELVLQLAVTGKLVPQDPNEAHAEELLCQIELIRGRTGKIAKGRRLEALPPVDHDDFPFDIPRGWAWCRLGTLGLIGSSCRVHEKDWTTSGVPFLRAREIVKLSKSGQVDNDLFITEEHYQRLASEGLTPEPDDMMITGVGTIGVPYIVKDTDRFYFKDASVLIMKNCFGLYPHYLHLVMQSPYWIREVHKESMGTTVHTLTIARAKQTPIPLPPLAEQKRIVAKVDELMGLCDRLEMQQKERETRRAALARASLARFADAPTPENLNLLFYPPAPSSSIPHPLSSNPHPSEFRIHHSEFIIQNSSFLVSPSDLRKTILTLAVQGKLVPQDPNDEPAEKLLQAISDEKQSLVRQRLLKKAEPIESAPYGRRGEILAHWRLTPLAAMCVAVTDGDHLPPPKAESGIPFLVISDVRWGGINFEGCRHVSHEYYDNLDWIRKPQEGDILYTLVGSFGIPIVVSNAQPFCVQRHIGILRPSKHIDRQYLNYALSSDLVFQQAALIATGIAQKTVPLAGLRKISIPLPPLAEQRRIVAKVDALMALVDALETQLATASTAATALLETAVANLTAKD